MDGKLVAVLAEFAEDIAVLLGAVIAAAGLGWWVTWPAGMVAFGVVAVGWGIWRTSLAKGGARWDSKAPEE